MAMKRIKDVAVKVGTYQSGGETKNKWENVGSLVEFDDGGQGLFLKRTFNPAGVPNPDGKEDLLLSFFDIKDKPAGGGGNSGGRQRAAAPSPAPGDDEIPFN